VYAWEKVGKRKKTKRGRVRDGFPVICLRYVHRVQCNMLMPKHDKRSVVVRFVLDKSIAKVNHLLKVEFSNRNVGRSWAYLKLCIAHFSPWQVPCSRGTECLEVTAHQIYWFLYWVVSVADEIFCFFLFYPLLRKAEGPMWLWMDRLVIFILFLRII
jgi:hypothetical protein